MSELVPVEQRTVVFYDDELTAVRVENGRIFASVGQMCSALGLDAQAQRRRIERHAVLSRGLGVAKLATPGGAQSAYVLRADLVPLWLSGVRASAVNEDARPKLVRFQEEAAAVLWEAFQAGELSADFGQLLEQADPEARAAYQMALAVVKLARQQIVLQAEVQEHGRRLDLLEAKLGDEERTITEAQATQISQAVKTVAIAYGKKTKKNEFGAIYGEMYRKFDTTSYKLIPAAKFQEVMDWLTEWHQAIVGDAPF